MQYGVIAEENYPYTSKNGIAGSCKYDSSKVLYYTNNMYKIKYNAPDVMK